MEYREIVAVTGLSGLYQLLTTKSDGAIVRNVADKSTKFISARQHNVTPLESIEVYTTGDNVRLHEVFKKMQEHEEQVPLADAKTANNGVIKLYFKTIFPDFDDERVYVSDMKKMLKWYELLKSNDLLRFETEDKGTQEGDAATEPIAEVQTDAAATETATTDVAAPEQAGTATDESPKPSKAPKKKKAAPETAGSEDEAPVKKTAKKKKTEGSEQDEKGNEA